MTSASKTPQISKTPYTPPALRKSYIPPHLRNKENNSSLVHSPNSEQNKPNLNYFQTMQDARSGQTPDPDSLKLEDTKENRKALLKQSLALSTPTNKKETKQESELSRKGVEYINLDGFNNLYFDIDNNKTATIFQLNFNLTEEDYENIFTHIEEMSKNETKLISFEPKRANDLDTRPTIFVEKQDNNNFSLIILNIKNKQKSTLNEENFEGSYISPLFFNIIIDISNGKTANATQYLAVSKSSPIFSMTDIRNKFGKILSPKEYLLTENNFVCFNKDIYMTPFLGNNLKLIFDDKKNSVIGINRKDKEEILNNLVPIGIEFILKNDFEVYDIKADNILYSCVSKKITFIDYKDKTTTLTKNVLAFTQENESLSPHKDTIQSGSFRDKTEDDYRSEFVNGPGHLRFFEFFHCVYKLMKENGHNKDDALDLISNLVGKFSQNTNTLPNEHKKLIEKGLQLLENVIFS